MAFADTLSVLGGGLLIGAAGLLRGHEATAYWPVADLLPMTGAKYVDRRVVHERNRLTGGGVTAGPDFGLTLAALLKGEDSARYVQLFMEYSPTPPFRNGTPAEAGAERSEAVQKQ
ncbi:DJ-1/PfpI family protein [Tardiphaga sp. OK246]|uniref:DJ-1/PfpI family protein n=1 Tax=Tardiphaga sp. OK246 TaxID=1855307 RepID=UPI000B77DCFF|nr:DJ-1/PfpI family protein [Tardiphaga sp. OK246]